MLKVQHRKGQKNWTLRLLQRNWPRPVSIYIRLSRRWFYFKHNHEILAGAKFALRSTKLQMFDDQSCHVWHPIRVCFDVTCSRIDASNGRAIRVLHITSSGILQSIENKQNSDWKKLDPANHCVFKTLLNTGNASNYNSILSLASMESLGYRCELSLSLQFKCIKENGPS